ncbi:UTP--glucose-1-phosphate uridylyltransferase [Sulfitobacter alexandrii]|uniref:UTP--glucose-1-phosphate uridylyltransferase n=1 Tax=Sulfitobacter alexandrii TaxID=1917485 RepID=A0A1J0WDP3_9RHOB|nr:UTP--glucose-1-phosphate uridylyltransferase [Sulfitobacter alexandrii]APE42419.1 UTP--glucose-1-phosphate uridylyltransferase [Sulfitobacter alexandrii]
MTHIRKAVFPVAGMGTRFLPATKSIPKEMLPLVDRPLIQYAVDEARAAGIEEFIFVTAAGKGALEDYFDTAAALEQRLAAAGKTDALAALERARMPEGALSFVRQAAPLGLGHAVRLAQRLVGDEPFAVLLPDDVIRSPQGALTQMVAAHGRIRGHMVATMEVPRQDTSSYGILDVARESGRLARARGLVEKPRPELAPSCSAVVGRYILEPSIFARLSDLGPGAGGELQLTDAINADVHEIGVTGYRFEGERFDCGSVLGFVQATMAFALDRPDLQDGIERFLETKSAPRQYAA